MAGEVERRIVAIAKRRHGAVLREELLAAGLSRRAIEHRLASGFLVAAYRGVYLVSSPAPSPLATHAAALLACRPRALLSHRTASGCWRLPVRADERIDVTVVGRTREQLANVRVHTIRHLAAGELRRVHGLPVSSPSLTILDVAGLVGSDELTASLHEARVQRLLTDHELRATLAAHPNRRGARALRRLLERERGLRLTRSEAERRALKVLRDHGLEPDESDFPIGPFTVDFYFRAERVAVEYDSRQFHDNPRSFVSDRRRIAYLAGRGILTFPLTDHDLGAGAGRAMADLRATLERRGEQA